MADKNDDEMKKQIQKAVEAGTQRRSLDELKKEGYSVVKVIDYATIQKLIAQAIDKILAERSRFLLDEEEQALKEQAHIEFEKLLSEQKKSIARDEQLEVAKRKINEEADKLVALIRSQKTAPNAAQLTLLENIVKQMAARQRVLLDKYKEADDLRRKTLAENVELNLKIDALNSKVEQMKSQGAAAPSTFIKEINELKDARELLKHRVNLLKRIVQNLAVEAMLLKQGEQPRRAPVGKGVQIIVGDDTTPRTGIKVRFDPVKHEPIITFPNST